MASTSKHCVLSLWFCLFVSPRITFPTNLGRGWPFTHGGFRTACRLRAQRWGQADPNPLLVPLPPAVCAHVNDSSALNPDFLIWERGCHNSNTERFYQEAQQTKPYHILYDCCSVAKLCPAFGDPMDGTCQASLSFTVSLSLPNSCPLSWFFIVLKCCFSFRSHYFMNV